MVCIYSDINKLINSENTFNWFPYSLWLATVVMIAKNPQLKLKRGIWTKIKGLLEPAHSCYGLSLY